MDKELKRAIINCILDNCNNFQLHNAINKEFAAYMYDSKGNYLIGGEKVNKFISDSIKLLLT